MEVSVKPKNFKLPDTTEGHIRKHVERLGRHVENLHATEVLLSQEPTRSNPHRLQYRVQLTLHTRNNIIRSEVSNSEVLTAVDEAMENVSRQVERHKARRTRKKKGSLGLGRQAADLAAQDLLDAPELPEATEDSANGAGEIVRVKSFTVKPMFPEDAVEQMELLGHNFFVFLNAADERMSVVYRRNDGNYGLIQPELS